MAYFPGRLPCSGGRSSVAWRDEVRWLTVGFRLTAGTGTGPASRFQPGREVPDDHCRPIRRARRVPSRVPRPDPRGLRSGSAPVHHLVPGPLPETVRRPPRQHRELRPGSASQGGAPVPPSPGGCPPSPDSTNTRSRKSSWTDRRPPTYAARGSTTSPMPSPWTATNSAHCWSTGLGSASGHALNGRSTWPSANGPKDRYSSRGTPGGWTGTVPGGSSSGSGGCPNPSGAPPGSAIRSARFPGPAPMRRPHLGLSLPCPDHQLVSWNAPFRAVVACRPGHRSPSLNQAAGRRVARHVLELAVR